MRRPAIEGKQSWSEEHSQYFISFSDRPADNDLNFEMAGGDFGNNTIDAGRQKSNNTATDKRVEISGVDTGWYPKVEVNSRDHTITMTFDWEEGCCVFDWYDAIVSGMPEKRSISIIEESSPGVESSRRNYYEVWPFQYDNFIGFGLDYQMKAQIVLSYDWSEAG